ncbi:hypothetical protein QVD17_27765 [Tagetes erecta]|uniref:Uncharacterized protein n=1 Tax=Tagetes erecta TaxID=13708 RepID=A0AAD8NJT5_TARER|nr:hypothetical protein QVD17_27765 [Tagetes erecta]
MDLYNSPLTSTHKQNPHLQTRERERERETFTPTNPHLPCFALLCCAVCTIYKSTTPNKHTYTTCYVIS